MLLYHIILVGSCLKIILKLKSFSQGTAVLKRYKNNKGLEWKGKLVDKNKSYKSSAYFCKFHCKWLFALNWKYFDSSLTDFFNIIIISLGFSYSERERKMNVDQ